MVVNDWFSININHLKKPNVVGAVETIGEKEVDGQSTSCPSRYQGFLLGNRPGLGRGVSRG